MGSAMWETRVQSLDWEDPLKKGTATHSNILAWRSPWTEGSLAGYSPWGRKWSDMTEQFSLHFFGVGAGALVCPTPLIILPAQIRRTGLFLH